MTRLRSAAPGLHHERTAWEAGAGVVVGIDEVGRGAWAGPITVAAVAVPRDSRLRGVRDSKQLSRSRREMLVPRIESWALATGVGSASAAECDALGMSAAQKLAASRALDRLGLTTDVVLVDGAWDFVGGARTIVGGDRRSLAIAAASVLAKVSRDTEMRRLADAYPWWGFDTHVGYPAPVHRSALAAWGPSAIHRTTWRWVEDLVWSVPRGMRHRGLVSRA